MVRCKLDKEEQEILNAFDLEKILPIPNAQKEMEKHKKYAATTFKKEKITLIIGSL